MTIGIGSGLHQLLNKVNVKSIIITQIIAFDHSLEFDSRSNKLYIFAGASNLTAG